MINVIIIFIFSFFLELSADPVDSLNLREGKLVEHQEEPLLSGEIDLSLERIYDPAQGGWRFNWPRLFVLDGDKIELPKESPFLLTYDKRGLLTKLEVRGELKNCVLEFREPNEGVWEIVRDNVVIATYYFKGALLQKIERPNGEIEEYYYKEAKSKEEPPLLQGKRINDLSTLFEYDGINRLSAVSYPENRRVDIRYQSRATEVDEGIFGKKIYSFTKEGAVEKIETFDKGKLVLIEQLQHSGSHLKKKILTSPLTGQKITFTYEHDALGQLICETVEKNGKSFSRKINYEGHFPIEETTYSGENSHFRFEPKSQKLLEKWTKEGPCHTFLYDEKGALIEEISAFRNETLVRRIERPTSSQQNETLFYNGEKVKEERRFFSDTGSLLLHQKFDGSGELCDENSFTYDQEARLIQKTSLFGNDELSIYNAQGDLERFIMNGEENRFHYDSRHRLVFQENGLSFEYDAKGRKIAESDPEGNRTDFVYDALGHLREVIAPAVLDEKGQVQRPKVLYEYDPLGNVIKEVDPLGYVTLYIRDARGEIEEIHYPDGGKERRNYGPNGALISIVKRTQEVVEVEKGLSLRPTPLQKPSVPSVRDKLIRSTTTNSLGQTVRQTRLLQPCGIEAVRTHDALGRVVLTEALDLSGNLLDKKEIVYTLTGDIAIERNDHFEIERFFGPMQRVEKVIERRKNDPEMVTLYRYNEKGLFKEILKNDGVALFYDYDSRGHIQRLYSSDGTVDHSFTHDTLGQIVSASDALGTALRLYNERGALLEESLSHGLKISKVFDEQGRATQVSLGQFGTIDTQFFDNMTRVERRDRNGELLFSKELTTDIKGRLQRLGDQEFTYTSEGKLSSIISPIEQQHLQWEGEQLTAHSFFSKEKSIEHNYAFDPLFRLQREDETTYEYPAESYGPLATNSHQPSIRRDKVGNIIELTANDKTLKLTYDALGRMISLDNGSEISHYIYDGFNRRIRKESSSRIVDYLYDGLFEIGSFHEESLYDLKITLSASLVTLGIEWNGNLYDAHIDFKGSVIALLSEETVLNNQYSAFGESKEELFPYGYCGKRLDPESGLIYFGSRYYSPKLGLFMTPDPKGTQDGLNPYHFAHFNPLYYSDAFGNSSFFDAISNFFQEAFKFIKNLGATIAGWWEKMAEAIGLKGFGNHYKTFAENLLGKGFLIINGSYIEEAHTGVYGEKEISDKARITFMHGILTLREHLIDNLKEISESHGSVRVHYVFRPSRGFTGDLIQCIMVKMGHLSQESRELINIWRTLIQEMGGTSGGGKITHYAHSLGGADTLNALGHLTPEEQAMIEIHTFGSAALIENNGNYKATNYVSKRDGVPLFDPVRYWRAWFGGASNIYFIGDAAGIPFIDHLMLGTCYHEIMKSLGQAFVTLYGTATL